VNLNRTRAGGFTRASPIANGVLEHGRAPLEDGRSIEVSDSGAPVAASPVTVSALLRVFAAVAASAAGAAARFVASLPDPRVAVPVSLAPALAAAELSAAPGPVSREVALALVDACCPTAE
jgi:hypothetical protein